MPNHSDDNLERDPQLARLLSAREADDVPPAALDAAILAAARREVGARLQTVDGGETVVAQRAKRNWYVPVSIAAVLVLSVSLVTLMKEERGDELAQPPTPPLAKAPKPAALPDAGISSDRAQPPPAITEYRAGEPQPMDAAAKEKRADLAAERAAVSKAVVPAPAPAPAIRTPELAQQRQDAPAPLTQERAPATSAAGAAANTAPAAAAPGVSPVPAPPVPAVPPPAATVPAVPPPPVATAPVRPEPFPAAREREAPAMRDTLPAPAARARVEADAAPMAEAAPPVVAAKPAPPPVVAARPALPPKAAREPTPAEDISAATAPAPASPGPLVTPGLMEKRVKPLARAEVQSAARPAWLAELDNQPPEKWLERLAQFKRDGRTADAEMLLNEFRRRFPQHPASAR